MLFMGESCNQVRGDYKVFVGRWRWEYATWYNQDSSEIDTVPQEDLISPDYVYELEINKKGEIHFLMNGTLQYTRHIGTKWNETHCLTDNGCLCLQNEKEYGYELNYNACHGYEQLIYTGPFAILSTDGVSMTNYFRKVE